MCMCVCVWLLTGPHRQTVLDLIPTRKKQVIEYTPTRCSGHDFFIVKPDNNPAMFSYAPGIGNLKYSCIASAFTKEASQGQLEC